MQRRRFLPAAIGLAVIALSVPLGLATAGDPLAELREATEQYHDIGAAGRLRRVLRCTDNESLDAAMGQHYANVGKVVDPAIDALDPEVFVYEPTPDGELRLVAVEYVVFQESWDASRPTPQLFGRTFTPGPATIGTACRLPTSSTSGSGRATRGASSTTGIRRSRAAGTATRHRTPSSSTSPAGGPSVCRPFLLGLVMAGPRQLVRSAIGSTVRSGNAPAR